MGGLTNKFLSFSYGSMTCAWSYWNWHDLVNCFLEFVGVESNILSYKLKYERVYIRGVQGSAQSGQTTIQLDRLYGFAQKFGQKLVNACENSRVFGWGWVAYNDIISPYQTDLSLLTELQICCLILPQPFTITCCLYHLKNWTYFTLVSDFQDKFHLCVVFFFFFVARMCVLH